MSDRILLTGLAFHGRHGVHPEEQAAGQPFLVDVELSLDLRAAAAGDDLSRTADYAAVYEAVRAVVEGPPRRLIETVAEEIAGRVLASFPVDAVTVRVHKPRAPLPGPFAGVAVEVTRRRP